ncbi:MAG: hypothetical protein F4234_12810 [Gammaproteobacteria bacterium]|nr:hypothetical protein [Gammaproteobacteria bacterium]MXZ32632.1 hypothetical protein [Gammaproteobacteria bacterium]MYA67513.1 hypothetical protein [Gammaproteobacteria bacterium]MYF01023.1 hypothetical protein [Gammaproteobacteria bacterium]MYG95406.1 hypothetical protein [Gammaproteobacteria bacterium]
MKIFFRKGTGRTISALLAGTAAMFLWSGPVAAQDLELFEDVERTGPAANQRGGRNGSSSSAAPSLTEPEFALIGSSLIGERRRVVLSHRSGVTVTVPVAAQGQTSIPGYEQFRIVTSEGGRVAIQYPAGSSCVEASDRGVSCDAAANIAWLSLRPAPVPEQFIVDLEAGEVEDPDTADQARDAREELARDPDNPFARLRAEALGQDVPRTGRFRPRRIDPSEVPPGMRVVSTPFGDRLVEID